MVSSENNISGEKAIGGSFRPHPSWGLNISQEMQNIYLQQISLYPLLTPEEERKWTKQHYESKIALHELMRGFPKLILAVAEDLLKDVSISKINSCFSLNEAAEGDDDKNIKDVFCSAMESVAALKANGGDAAEAVKVLLAAVTPRDEFFKSCNDKLEKTERRSEYIGRLSWDKLKKNIDSLTYSMKEAADRLIEHNLRLVLSIAGHYGSGNIPFADLVQEGNIGLMRAVERFNYKLGHRFTTYASYWIRQAISKYLTNHGRIIRMPANTIAMISSIRQIEQRILSETGELPTADAIAVELGVSATKVRALQRMTQQTISLQSTMDDDTTLEDTLADSNDASFYETLDGETLRNALYSAIYKLDEREQKILRLRFGLDDDKPLTLVDVSAIMGISSERVRQIEYKALVKIRSSLKDNRH